MNLIIFQKLDKMQKVAEEEMDLTIYNSKLWKSFYSKENLYYHYYNKISHGKSIGLDKITPKKFEEKLDDEVDIIIRKVGNGTYHFTRYKQELITKGPDKLPRVICIPTIRDKLTSSVLNELMAAVYGQECKTIIPHYIIRDILQNISRFDSFIKLDVKSFYASIDQDRLMAILKQKINETQILTLITNAIKTEAIPDPINKRSERIDRTKGIPEGLPISNILANIYINSIDKKYKSVDSIAYYRFVDDILVLSNKDEVTQIKQEIDADLKELGLETNEKEAVGKIADSFEYLGYSISDKKISVRPSSILKMEQSLEELFRAIRRDKLEYLEWKLNLKITGFIIGERNYGWLFFFSQITDLSLLYHLDDLVSKLIRRYRLEGKIKVKRFVRAYYEIRHGLRKSKYIPNFDNMSISDKRSLLSSLHHMDLAEKDDNYIENLFDKSLKK